MGGSNFMGDAFMFGVGKFISISTWGVTGSQGSMIGKCGESSSRRPSRRFAGALRGEESRSLGAFLDRVLRALGFSGSLLGMHQIPRAL